MSGTQGALGSKATQDTIKELDAVAFTLGGAANSFTYNPTKDQTSLTVFNRSDYDAKVTVKGKDATGAAVTRGIQISPGNNSTISLNFNDYVKAGDTHVLIDEVTVQLWDYFTTAADGAAAAGAAITAATVVGAQFIINFNNS